MSREIYSPGGSDEEHCEGGGLLGSMSTTGGFTKLEDLPMKMTCWWIGLRTFDEDEDLQMFTKAEAARQALLFQIPRRLRKNVSRASRLALCYQH